MSASQTAYERQRNRHAAIIAAKPDARFLVQLIAGSGARNNCAENKTAPYKGAAAYSSVMDGTLSARSDTSDHAA